MTPGREIPRTATRHPAVAGSFYPGDPAILRGMIDDCLAGPAVGAGEPPPKALIAPHAGYIYSGPVAASAYARLSRLRGAVRRVVLLGPSHFVPLDGLAASSAQAFVTPFGSVEVEVGMVEQILTLPQVQTLDAAHLREHSLEVHLPFLQAVLERFTLVPLVVGRSTANEVAEVLERLWGGSETLIVISSDLSHYHPYERARRIDSGTCEAILALEPDVIGPDEACGCRPINGLLEIARRLSLNVRCLDLRNSGDTAGDKNRVVGYASFMFS